MFACWLYWSDTELLIASFLVESILISANKITEERRKEEGLIDFRSPRTVVGYVWAAYIQEEAKFSLENYSLLRKHWVEIYSK